MNSNKVGDASEASVIAKLLSRGYDVSVPFGDDASYDLIADDGDELYRVQVKTARKEDGRLITSLEKTAYGPSGCSHSSYEKGEIDGFCIYSPCKDEAYWVCYEEAPKTAITLRTKPAKNGQTKGIRMAEDYRLGTK